MNMAQWFMVVQIITCVGGAVGFTLNKQPWHGLVWFFYGLANIGWLMAASGKA